MRGNYPTIERPIYWVTLMAPVDSKVSAPYLVTTILYDPIRAQNMGYALLPTRPGYDGVMVWRKDSEGFAVNANKNDPDDFIPAFGDLLHTARRDLARIRGYQDALAERQANRRAPYSLLTS